MGGKKRKEEEEHRSKIVGLGLAIERKKTSEVGISGWLRKWQI